MNKKQIRKEFVKAVLKRDGFRCVMCGKKDCTLDCHHIKDRKEIVNGGYVAENGITLCSDNDTPDSCHWKAEQYHITGKSYPGYSPEELYAKIGSSLEKAIEASEKEYFNDLRE